MSDKFDGFSITLIEEDDGDWLAHFVELPRVSAVGNTPEMALHQLEAAWELLKEGYREDGREIPIAPLKKEYSGQFNVRIDRRVHRALVIEAARAGITLNALVAQKLSNQVKNFKEVA